MDEREELGRIDCHDIDGDPAIVFVHRLGQQVSVVATIDDAQLLFEALVERN